MPGSPNKHQRRARGACSANTGGVHTPGSAKAPLPAIVVSALGLALADERGALATYLDILERFGEIRPFVNIARAEQRHIDALLSVYARYQVPVPDNVVAVDPATRTLDVAGLCRVGVAAETENVRLYDEELLPAVAAYPDISSVLKALREASANNHLPAFERCVSRAAFGPEKTGLEP